METPGATDTAEAAVKTAAPADGDRDGGGVGGRGGDGAGEPETGDDADDADATDAAEAAEAPEAIDIADAGASSDGSIVSSDGAGVSGGARRAQGRVGAPLRTSSPSPPSARAKARVGPSDSSRMLMDVLSPRSARPSARAAR
jgi:hypothetical protein